MNKSIFQDFPSEHQLIDQFENPFISSPLEVNAHFHTPYSFSAFESIHEIFERAEFENVDVLGINDFITTFGYVEFNELAQRYNKFPIFCLEFMGLVKEAQQKGIRINDPNNPGRIYFCGKGLAFPEKFSEQSSALLQRIFDESNHQTERMTEKLNQYLKEIKAPFLLDFKEILENDSKGMVRERHLAKVLRNKIEEHFPEDKDKREFLIRLYQGKPTTFDHGNFIQLDNELRSNLLKKGGAAFVEEDEDAFLSIEQMQNIILDAKGIPCYPVLLDDSKGNFTEFEADYERLFVELAKRKIYAMELIPGRNRIQHLKKFVQFFSEKGFIITMGTEHNTPEMTPLRIQARDHQALDRGLKAIAYYGACILGAHQYRVARGKEGYLTKEGFPRLEKQDEFVTLGNAVIRYFTKK